MGDGDNRRGSPPAFLSGGGELARLIREKDWSQTPLGPVEGWSSALRMMIGFLLANRFPLLLWWGPHYASIYNDAYRPILGRKHPASLGQPVSEVWAEIWDVLQPLIDTPFNGGTPTWMEDLFLEINRYGFVEETHFTVAYSPVPDEMAPRGVGGVLATVHEITEKVIGERRVQILRDLGAGVAKARTAEQSCAFAAATLSKYDWDIPFALLYLIDAEGKLARLAGAAGIEVNQPASPLVVDLQSAAAAIEPWPLVRVAETGTTQIVEAIGARLSSVPRGPWPDPPHTAILVPIKSNAAYRLAGVLVAGVSPRLRFDELYRSFLELVATQIATAVANARAYEEERKRAEALAEIDRAKTAFFSNVSHEFRTPLTLLLGPLEEALEGTGLSAEDRERLEVAHRNSLRLLKLVNSLLDFSRIEARRLEAVYERTDLASFTAALASNFRSACERAGVALVVDCPPPPLPVHVDRDMWEKIVLNLLSNAFKFTFEGEIAVRLRAGVGQAELSVSDTGVGIPKHEMPRLFERFHRIGGQQSRTHEGSGIGLALVQELVKLHGGTIDAESEEGRGTTFTISVPFGTAHLPSDRIKPERELTSTAVRAEAYVEEALRWLPGETAAWPEAPRDIDAPGIGPRLRGADILLADDNADMRAYIQRLLGKNCAVRAVTDGEAAIAALRDRRADLVLADVMMPRLDGFGLLHAIREDPALRDIPVIMLSARAGEESRVQGLEAGADDYLVKPFSARELIARIGAHVELARLRRDAMTAVRASEARLAAELAATQRLQQASTLLIQEGNVDALYDQILEAAVAIMRSQMASMQLLDPERSELQLLAAKGFDPTAISLWERVSPATGSSCGMALRAGHRVLLPDIDACESSLGGTDVEAYRGAGIRAAQSTPLVSRSGRVLGMISTHWAKPHRPSDDDLRLFDVLVRQAADLIERTRAEAQLRELNDSLERRVAERTRELEDAMAERRKVEAAMQHAQRLEAVGQLTGGVAHDFNNLLTVVVGQSEVIAAAAKDDGIRRRAEAIGRAAERGAKLTAQLLSFSRRQRLNPAAVSIGQLIANIDELVRRAVGEQVAVEFDAERGLWPSLVDPTQFESAILNLALNARDAMPEGGRLEINARNIAVVDATAVRLDIRPGDYVVVTVADNGTGMTAAVREHAFEPFFTTKDVGKGTGLGLAQIYGFVRQSGGAVALESTLGTGTTVSLYLPRAQIEAAEERPLAGAAAPKNAERSRTILVVEDQPEVREVIEASLNDLGYRTLTASDGIEACQVLESDESIDLLLTDLVMPNGLGGLELAEGARLLRQDLKIVLISGYSRDARLRVTGPQDDFLFLEKPFRQAELARTIAAALDPVHRPD